MLFSLWTLLGITFEIPLIQYKEPGYILDKFHQGGTSLLSTWIFLLTPGILFIPAVVMIRRFLERENTPYLGVAVTCGIIAWVLQYFGLVRWIFVVPVLAEQWADPAAGETTRVAAEMVLRGINQFAGFALGQYVGIAFNAFWLALIAWPMLDSQIFKPWLGWVGLILALGQFVGNFAPLGTVLDIPFSAVTFLNNLSGLSFNGMYVWMIIVAVILWKLPPEYDEKF